MKEGFFKVKRELIDKETKLISGRPLLTSVTNAFKEGKTLNNWLASLPMGELVLFIADKEEINEEIDQDLFEVGLFLIYCNQHAVNKHNLEEDEVVGLKEEYSAIGRNFYVMVMLEQMRREQLIDFIYDYPWGWLKNIKLYIHDAYFERCRKLKNDPQLTGPISDEEKLEYFKAICSIMEIRESNKCDNG